MKRILSLLLCAVMCISVFSATATEVYAVGSVKSIFTVSKSELKNDTVTYTISLAPNQTKVAGVAFKIIYDSNVLKVSDETGPAGETSVDGDLVASIKGLYEYGVVYNNENEYAIAFHNSEGYTVGNASKDFVNITFEVCSDERPYTEIEIFCEEFITNDGNSSNDILKSDTSQRILYDRFLTLHGAEIESVYAEPEGLTLSWATVTGAQSYNIYRKTSDSQWSIIETINDGSVTEYTDKTAQKGVQYYYTISVSNIHGTTDYDEIGVSGMNFGTISSISAVATEDGISVSWNALDAADSYGIFRKKADTEWVKVGASETNSFLDENAYSGYEYFYTIEAYKGENSTMSSCEPAAVRYIATPRIVFSKINASDIMVNWTASGGAESYIVYRKAASETKFTKKATVSVNKYNDADVKDGVEYSYKIKAVGESAESAVPSSGYPLMKLPITSQVTTTLKDDGINVTWKAVSVVEKYKIYRRRNNGGLALIATVDGKKTSYSDKTTESGKSYTYAISTVYGDYETVQSTASEKVVFTGIPKITSVTKTTSGMKIDFTPITNADGYSIYRKKVGGSYDKLATIDDAATATYTDTEAVKGVQYIYGVSVVFDDFESSMGESGVVCDMATPVITATEPAYNGIIVKWNKVEGAQKYIVYHNIVGKDKKAVAEVDASKTSYTHKGAASAKTNQYIVVAVCGDMKTESVKKGWYYVASPTKASLSNNNGYVKFSWNAVDEAESYYVYRKASGASSWSYLGLTTKTYFNDKTAKSGTTYYYTVSACDEPSVEEDGELSVRNPNGWKIKYLSTPKVTATNASSGVAVKWGKITGASGYYVYRKTSSASSYTKIATIKSGSTVSYTDKTAKSGTKYYYTVKAYNGDYVSTTKSSSLMMCLATPNVTVANASSGVTVKWGKITGAKGYYVYRKASGAKSWTKITTVKSGSTVSYTDKKAKAGTTYTYTVKAYNGDYVSTTKASSAIEFLKAPTIKSVTSGKTGVTVKWAKTTGADGYYVYRKTGSGSYSKIATVKGNTKVSYLDKSAKKGKTYTYYVKAYSGKSVSTSSKTLKIKDKY